MRTRTAIFASAVLFPLMVSTPAQAQRVTADIRIGGGPVSGHIIVGNDHGWYESRPRVIRRVEWIRAKDHRRDDWYRRFQREARVVIVFYDRRDDRYYYDRYRSGLQEIRVFERDGRFYRFEDDRFDRRYDERWDDRRYDRRYDDRWDARRDDRNDDRRDNRRDRSGDRRDN